MDLKRIYADKEAKPLYPVLVLMDAEELEKFYWMLMPEQEELAEEYIAAEEGDTQDDRNGN